ncbi:MAG TPA: hypothetical protein VJ851_14160 [Jatrophihabitans sp.]|nr:hypothetical protein [Jatrophihabitans sp.]
MSSEARPVAVDHAAADDAAAEDELVRIEAALARLTEPVAVSDQPLAGIAASLDDLHQELQAALAGLDRS